MQEFEAICESWQKMRDAEYKENWERVRMLATITIQPHVKQKLTAQKLLPFDWDKKILAAPKAAHTAVDMEKRRQRMAEIAAKLETI